MADGTTFAFAVLLEPFVIAMMLGTRFLFRMATETDHTRYKRLAPKS